MGQQIRCSIEIDKELLKKGEKLSEEYYISEELTISQILSKLEIETKYIGMIIVNNRIVDLDYEIKNNDVLKIYPFMSGG